MLVKNSRAAGLHNEHSVHIIWVDVTWQPETLILQEKLQTGTFQSNRRVTLGLIVNCVLYVLTEKRVLFTVTLQNFSEVYIH